MTPLAPGPTLLSEIVRRLEAQAEPSGRPAVAAGGAGDWPALPSRYRTIRPLGRGGEGRIFEAHDQVLDRRVALKVLRHGPFEPGVEMPGLREARLLARFDHPGIIAVHDLIFEPERTFLVMRLVRGVPLCRVIAHLHQDHVPPRSSVLFELIGVVARLCEVVEHAHEAGGLHLDIKPGNVLLGHHGEAFLLDWGSGQTAHRAGPASEMLGTVGFMAPEQWTDPPEALDGRADVHGLGALLFAILEGERPPSALDAWQPSPAFAPLAPVIEAALQPDRARRTPTVRELRRQLLACQQGAPRYGERFAEPGEDVVREGEPGRVAFLIESGRCEAYVHREGRDHVLRRMGPGEVFGELCLFTGGRRTASVRAVEPTVLRTIEHTRLLAGLEGSEPWLRSMVESMARRVLSPAAGPLTAPSGTPPTPDAES